MRGTIESCIKRLQSENGCFSGVDRVVRWEQVDCHITAE